MPTEPACLLGPAAPPDRLCFTPTVPTAMTFGWGGGLIVVHQDGRLTLEGFGSLDEAARAFWDAVARWAPPQWRVTLPWQVEGEPHV